jgi:hypothetical protein
MVDKLLVLLEVPVDGLLTMGNCNQWWVSDWKRQKQKKRQGKGKKRKTRKRKDDS